MEKPVSIIRPWKGGLNNYSLYFTIPAEIVKKLGISEDTHLTIKIQDESKIIITKESEKIKQKKLKPISKHTEISNDDDDNDHNPLDEVF
jgi:bifunctional DNA-binding transcriptional regulator/antitoxin component of YhaV-PrlF toxin-antitoxin module